jgi:hypothetical protein
MLSPVWVSPKQGSCLFFETFDQQPEKAWTELSRGSPQTTKKIPWQGLACVSRKRTLLRGKLRPRAAAGPFESVLNVFKRRFFCPREIQGGVERVEAGRFGCPPGPDRQFAGVCWVFVLSRKTGAVNLTSACAAGYGSVQFWAHSRRWRKPSCARAGRTSHVGGRRVTSR